LAEASLVARQGLVLGVLNRQSLLGRRSKREGRSVWGVAQHEVAGRTGDSCQGGGRERGNLVANQILVPLDGSALAEQALSCAVMLGQGLPAELVLFRAVSIPSDLHVVLDQAGPQADAVVTWLEAKADEYLSGVANSLRNAGLSVRHVVQLGAAAEAILDYAAQMDACQIVMATHGYTGLKRWTHGSVAERVLQAAGVPLLLVRARQEDAERGLQQPTLCQRILVPLDGSELAEQVLPVVGPIARVLEAKITLLQVTSRYVSVSFSSEWYPPVQSDLEMVEQHAKAYLERMAGGLREQGIEASTAIESGMVAQSIIEYAEGNRIDLIAMSTHGRTGLARWALGSVADRVLRAAGIPILLVRAS
jgi:nucleotide-binding universal stress UspA family protein